MTAVRTEIRDHIATITLTRPPVNAVSRLTLGEIQAAFEALRDRAEVRVVVFTGEGKNFCAGADLKATDDRPTPLEAPSAALDSGRGARGTFEAIGGCAVPVICAVKGVALGAGAALATMCDVIICADDAEFGYPEINVGLLGGIAHLEALVGRFRSRALYFTGQRIGADELLRIGAVAQVVPADDLQEAARAMATEIAKKSPIAVRLAKEAMARIDGLPLLEAYRIEQDYTARLSHFDDAAEARRARAEQREPNWGFK
jgi:enoyl-CoA hydratase